MIDIERELKEMFARREPDVRTVDPGPAAGIRRRVRTRQIMNAAFATLAVAALVGGSIVGVDRLTRGERDRVTVATLPTAPEGSRAVALPRLSIVYPEDWYLLALEPEMPEVRLAQLTNFDPAFGPLDCDAGGELPPGGVLLDVRLGAPADVVGVWPQELDPMPGAARPCGAAQVLAAEWTAESTTDMGLRYSAIALIGEDAVDRDVERLRTAFASMTFPADGQPQTQEPLGYPALVLDSTDSDLGPLALYVYASDGRWLGVIGPPWFRLGAAKVRMEPPEGDEDVTMVLGEHGGVVWGIASHAAVRAELFTVEGKTFPAELVALTESVGWGDIQAVWGVIEGETSDRVTTILYDSDGSVLNPTYPLGPDVTIAEGTHPDGGPWRLYVKVSNEGAGLWFAFTDGGGGCCMRPLGDNDLFQLGWSGSSDRSIPHDIEGLASTRVARVEYLHADGRVFEGALYPIPDRFIGPASALLIFVPGDVPIDGEVLAYDASGTVLQRQELSSGEVAGPTAEIDAVWKSLRAARDAVSRYLRQAGTLVTVTPEDMHALVPGVTFNASASVVPNEVSLRGPTEREIALVSSTEDGDVYCIAVEATEGGGNYGYGRQDAATPDECRGGWN